MSHKTAADMPQEKPFRLNYKRTFLIGFAFFGILLLWQVYDSWCPTFLTDLFTKAIYHGEEGHQEDVQYLVGVMMALDNLAALIMLPIFGHLSDKTHTKIGKRMPYILVGTFVCVIAFPFIPVFFYLNNLAGTIAMMAIVVFFAMMYRNPAVSLMPDMTPKPLRSKANGIINIMGYIGGAFATIVGIVFVLSEYLGTKKNADGTLAAHSRQYHNIWAIEAPFLIASVLMLISALVLFFNIKENKIEEEMADEMARGEAYSEAATKITEDAPLSKSNRTMLMLILIAEFFWFMAENGIGTFMGNYTIYYLAASSRSNMMNTIVGGIGSVLGFAVGGIIASKIGRKWTLISGLGLTLAGYLLWTILNFTVLKGAAGSGSFPFVLYLIWAIKGFGMSLVHVNSYPMVVELCSNRKIGRFTGYYYAASMAAQTITPCLLGLLLLHPRFNFGYLPIYALSCISVSFLVFLFVKNVRNTKTSFKKGLESMDAED